MTQISIRKKKKKTGNKINKSLVVEGTKKKITQVTIEKVKKKQNKKKNK